MDSWFLIAKNYLSSTSILTPHLFSMVFISIFILYISRSILASYTSPSWLLLLIYLFLAFSLMEWYFLISLSISTIFKFSSLFYFFVSAHCFLMSSLCFSSGWLFDNFFSLSSRASVMTVFSSRSSCSYLLRYISSFSSFWMYITFCLMFAWRPASIFSFKRFIYLSWASS